MDQLRRPMRLVPQERPYLRRRWNREQDGKVVEKIEGLANPTAVAVDSNDAIYIGEVNGTNVKKFIKK